MPNSQFRVGDRVVVIKPWDTLNNYVNEPGTVELIGRYNDLIVKLDNGTTIRFDADMFVLEEIYNSPLYQALRED